MSITDTKTLPEWLRPASDLVRAPVCIAGTGSYLPERIMTNADFAGRSDLDTTCDWIEQRTGIVERRIVEDGEFTSDIAMKASERAMEMAGVKARDIDLILAATLTPDSYIPTLACWLQQRLGCREVGAIDLNAACSGFVYTMGIARNLAALDGYRNILVVGAETMSRIVDWNDRQTCVIFGDGAGAAILQPSRNGTSWFGPAYLGSLGREDLFSLPGGGSRRPATVESVRRGDHTMKMNGREIFKFVVNRCIKMIRYELQRHDISMDEVKYIIPHQANQRIMDAIADRIGVPRDKVFSNIAHVGNTSAASVPIALDEMNRKGLIERGDLLLFCAFGAGITWASTLVSW